MMKVFWNERGRGPENADAEPVDLNRAAWIWTEELRGVPGNFFGLVDDNGRVVQFLFDAGIPNHVEDAEHLEIVVMDFPIPSLGGSYTRRVKIGDVDGLIRKAFEVGADHRRFEPGTFASW